MQRREVEHKEHTGFEQIKHKYSDLYLFVSVLAINADDGERLGEQGAPDTNLRCAFFNRDFEVVGHTHGALW